MPVPNVIKRYPVTIYFTLTFVISWGFIVLILGPDGIPVDPEDDGDLLPMVYTGMLIGPSLAAILSSLLVDGNAGPGKLLRRLFNWNIKIHWYALALLAVPFLASLILAGLTALSADFMPVLYGSGSEAGPVISGLVMGLVVGSFEEIGWTGFAVPRLRREYTIFHTGLITGTAWGAWHFLVFWENDSFSGSLALALLFSRLFAWLPPFRVIMVWLYDRTGSLPVTILLHASLVFTTLVIVPMDLQGINLLIWILTWGVTLWIISGLVISANRKRLNTGPEGFMR